MKASDSVNSLTELNPSESSDPSCFICLENQTETGEPLVDSKLLRNCGCRFFVHPACWNAWIKGKSDYDCPICHKASVTRIHIPPNPVLAIAYEEEPRRYVNTWKFLFFTCVLGVVCFIIASIILWGK